MFVKKNGNSFVTRYSFLFFEVENFQTKTHHLALENGYCLLTRFYYVQAYWIIRLLIIILET